MMILSILAFLVLFSVLVLVHEWGHYRAAKWANVRVEEFGLGLGKKLFGVQRGETEFTLNAVPFGGFVRMTGEAERESPDPRSFPAAKLHKRMIITLAGVFMNFIFAILTLTILFTAGTDPILVSRADVQRAAAEGTLTLSEPNENGLQRITDVQQIKLPVHQAFAKSFVEVGRISRAVLEKVAEIPTSLIEKGELPEGLSGPVGIAEVTHKVLPQGFLAMLRLAALLSVSLAVMNLLPIPALDGGLLVFQLYEAVTGRTPSPKIESMIHFGGFLFLMAFLLVITWADIMRIFFA